MSDREGRTESVTREELEDVLSRLFRSGRTNALLSWLLVAVLVVVFVESLLEFDWLWIAFVAATGAVVLVPPVAHREFQVMLPWELLVLALLPILVRGFVGGELGTFSFYLAIAALALIIAVEIHMFTALRMTHWFAITFVVMTTMAAEASWTVLRWNADRHLGTEFLGGASLGQDAANAALMTEWAYVTLAGFAAGVLFDAYFRRRGRRLRQRIRTVIRG
ncbi:hypothetical protein KY092_07495 [Natronomonas gomsonensis]|jgi:hypothetical protein|uniref:hypothetical protein n=1 Tax=Natronomonas gomsonensis TaxID=1046043 RepID=UPI0020CA681B|nr:hypothetical protein [Natronomonas gomsonensis]MCY4730398.1 hypothetical protein [Natronomonas gomsonensis]